MSDLFLYNTEDGRSQIKLREQEHTVWLTQLAMAELFDATRQNIYLRLKNVCEDEEGELKFEVRHGATCKVSPQWEPTTRT